MKMSGLNLVLFTVLEKSPIHGLLTASRAVCLSRIEMLSYFLALAKKNLLKTSACIGMTVLSVCPPLYSFAANTQHYRQALQLAGRHQYEASLELLKQQIAEDSSFTLAYVRLTEFYGYARKTKAGQKYLQEATERFPGNPNFHFALALMARGSRDWPAAFDHCVTALARGLTEPEVLDLLVEAAFNSKQEGRLGAIFRTLKKNKAQSHLYLLGSAIRQFRTKHFKRARASLLKYVKNRKQNWYSAYWLGLVAKKLHDSQKRHAYLDTSLKLAPSFNPNARVRVELELARYYQSVNLDSAKAYFDQARATGQEIGDQLQLITIYRLLADFYLRNEYHAKTIEFCGDGIQIARELEDQNALIHFYQDLAFAWGRLGDRSRAIQYYEQSAKIATGAKDGSAVARANLGIGRQYMKLQLWDKALAYLKQSLKISQGQKLTPLEYEAVFNLGEVEAAAGELEKARQNYEKVVRFGQKSRDYDLVEHCFLKLAHLYLKPVPDLEKAQYYLHLADFLAMETVKIQYSANHRWMQGNIALLENNFEDAETLFLNAVNLGKETATYLALLAGKAGLTRTYLKANRPDLAEAQADSTLNYLTKIGNLYLQDPASVFFDLKEDFFFPAIQAYAKSGNLARVYEICENIKFKKEIHSLSAIQFNPQSAMPDSLKWRLHNLTRQILDKRLELSEAWHSKTADDPQSIQRIKDELNESLYRLEALELTNAKAYPKEFGLIDPHAAPLKEVNSKLKALHGSLVYYLVGENSTSALVIRPDSVFYSNLDINKADLQQLCEPLHPMYSPRALNHANSGDSAYTEIPLEVLGKLYQILFKPIEKWLPEQSLILISTNDVLNFLPFECLVKNYQAQSANFDYLQARFLVQDFQFAYLPNATWLVQDFQDRQRPDRTFLALANSKWDAKEAVKFVRPFSSNKQSDGYTEAQAQNNDPRFMAEELGEVAESCNSLDIATDTESYAARKPLFQALSHFQIVHLALPVLLDDRQPLFSKLFFPFSKGAESYLNTYEIFGLQLNADVVGLSNCNVEPGLTTDREALHALVHGFLYAGAKSVLTDLWNIHDSKTAQLLSGFYQYLKSGLSKSAALQQAKLDFMSTHSRNPYYWGRYVLIGNPEPIRIQAKKLNYWASLAVVAMLAFVVVVIYRIKRLYRG
ncbi:MAG: CHAT domain-containing protein [bacterium]